MARNKNLPTYQVFQVIGFLLSVDTLGVAGKEYWGSAIANATGISSRTLYPILSRLTEAGFLTMKIEEGNDRELGRPLRKFYELTKKGRRFGYMYNTRTIAMCPKLVPLESFK